MFEGTLTALVTPFDAKGAVDFRRLENLIEMQIRAGVDGIVPVGNIERRTEFKTCAESRNQRGDLIQGGQFF